MFEILRHAEVLNRIIKPLQAHLVKGDPQTLSDRVKGSLVNATTKRL